MIDSCQERIICRPVFKPRTLVLAGLDGERARPACGFRRPAENSLLHYIIPPSAEELVQFLAAPELDAGGSVNPAPGRRSGVFYFLIS